MTHRDPFRRAEAIRRSIRAAARQSPRDPRPPASNSAARALFGLCLASLLFFFIALPSGGCVSDEYYGWTIEGNMARNLLVYRSDLGTASFVYDPRTERVTGTFDTVLVRFPLVVSGTIRNPVTMNVAEAALDQGGSLVPLEIPEGGNIVSFREEGTVALPGFQVVIDGHVRTILGTWELVSTYEVAPQ